MAAPEAAPASWTAAALCRFSLCRWPCLFRRAIRAIRGQRQASLRDAGAPWAPNRGPRSAATVSASLRDAPWSVDLLHASGVRAYQPRATSWENRGVIPTRPARAGAVPSFPRITLIEWHLIAIQQRSEFCLKGFALVMLLLPADVGFQLGHPRLTRREGCVTGLPIEWRKLRSLGFQRMRFLTSDWDMRAGCPAPLQGARAG